MSSRTLLSSLISRAPPTFKIQRSIPLFLRYQPRTAYSTMTPGGPMLKLNTGATMPALGFGTWQDKDAQVGAVTAALAAGYRHIDTARIYGTEGAVGEGIRKSGVPRSEIFVTTKLWNNAHRTEDVGPALDASLKDLGLDYVDLFLMHWPSSLKSGDTLMPRDDDGKLIPGDADYVDTYRGMEKCVKDGKAKAIGVSNFSKAEMERLLKETSVVPASHQLEMHPYLQQPSFQAWHAEHGIIITQYSPLGNTNDIYDAGKKLPPLVSNETLSAIGSKHGPYSPAQVAIAWGLSRGNSVIPKSKTEKRIQQNFEATGLKLDEEDIKKIEGMDGKARLNDPSKGFGWDFFADLDGKVKN